MAKTSRKEARRAARRRQQMRGYIIWGGLGVALIGVLAVLVWNAVKPAAGEEVPIMASRDHVPEGSDPGPHNTDPPTSGPHYASTLRAGFYEESDLEGLGEFPEGYLLHSLEHGYVIFYYNCDNYQGDCETLKQDIQGVMAAFENFKVIAVPWESIAEPVVMTSWGRMLRVDRFDTGEARQFVDRNRFRAPEPNAP